MHLHDPQRPKLANGTKAWLNGCFAIGYLELRLLPDAKVEVSIWMPIQGEGFAAKRWSKVDSREQLPELLAKFESDPETFCETYFTDPYGLKPELRNLVSQKLEPEQEVNGSDSTKPIRRKRSINLPTIEIEW